MYTSYQMWWSTTCIHVYPLSNVVECNSLVHMSHNSFVSNPFHIHISHFTCSGVPVPYYEISWYPDLLFDTSPALMSRLNCTNHIERRKFGRLIYRIYTHLISNVAQYPMPESYVTRLIHESFAQCIYHV